MIKKYEMATGTFYLQEIPILDKPSPFNSVSLTIKEVDFSDYRLLNIVEEDDHTSETIKRLIEEDKQFQTEVFKALNISVIQEMHSEFNISKHEIKEALLKSYPLVHINDIKRKLAALIV